MKLENSIKIDLLNFLKTGKFGCIKLGQEKSWVLNNFPAPDEGYSPNNDEFEIFSYGAMELNFRKDILYLIFTDYINIKSGKKALYTGKSLRFINQSFFGKKGKLLRLPYVVNSLIEKKINYNAEWSKSGADAVEVTTQGGVQLLFESENEPDNIKSYQLVAMSYYSEKFSSQ